MLRAVHKRCQGEGVCPVQTTGFLDADIHTFWRFKFSSDFSKFMLIFRDFGQTCFMDGTLSFTLYDPRNCN